jgi:superfamily II DNA or RNA helicase
MRALFVRARPIVHSDAMSASSNPHRMAPPLPEERLSALVDEIAHFPTLSMVRGRSYANSGRVAALSITPLRIGARVRGTREYDVSWTWVRDGWSPDCNCPVGVHCKHTYAVACSVLMEARRRSDFYDRRLRRLLPQDPTGPAPGALAGPSDAPRSVAPGEATGFAGASRSGGMSPFGAGRRRVSDVDRLLTGRDFWERHAALQRLFLANRELYLSAYDPPFPEILRHEDAEVMAWMLANALHERTGGTVPEELAPFLERPDLARRHEDAQRDRLAGELVTWARQRRAVPDRSLRAVLGLERMETGEVSFTFEARVTSPRLEDEPRDPIQLQQLRSSLRRNPGLLSPEEVALLEILTDTESPFVLPHGGESAISTTGLVKLLEWFADSPLFVWDEKLPSDLAEKTGVVPGAPVRFCREPVRVLPTAGIESDGLRVKLGYFWQGGRERRVDQVLHFVGREDYRRQRSVIISDGEISLVVEEPPRSVVGLFRAGGGLPVARERFEDLIAPLTSFESVRTALASVTRHHRVRPVVTLDLGADDWLQLRLFARDPASEWRPGQAIPKGLAVFEYSPDARWVELVGNRSAERVIARFDAMGGAVRAEEGPPQEAAAESAPNGRATGVGGSASSEANASDALGATGASLAPREPHAIATDAPAAAPPGGFWLDAPEPGDIEEIVEWLAATGARPGKTRGSRAAIVTAGESEPGWWIHLGSRTAVVVDHAWERRPEACDWFGNERARRLLSGVLRVHPRLRVESSGIDWFSVSAQWESEGLELTDADLAKLRASSGRLVKLPQGWVRRDVVAVHDEAAEVLADLGIEVGPGPQRLSIWQLAHAAPESLAALERFGADKSALRHIQKLRDQVAGFSGLPRVPVPAGFHGELRPYQQDGLDFLSYTAGIGLGTILADDMGLGKTIQALAWLQRLKETGEGTGPSLVVCPASVMHNWVREAERFVPELRVLMLERGATRHALRREIPAHDLIVTNYALLRRDIEAWKSLELSVAILDEAQNVKNPDAAISRAVLDLKAKRRLALTGTPLENRALDLWSLMAFVNPGYLGNRNAFSARYDRLDGPPHARRLLSAKLRPVMLRRLKGEVAKDLPDRIEERRDCPMTRGQRQLYVAELMKSRAIIDRLAREHGGIQRSKIEVLAALTRLRQICCHPALVGGKESLGSGKFDVLFELLEPLLAEGHKVLLFSQFVECLKLIEAQMTARAIPYHMLTGSTIHRERVVEAFGQDPNASVFLISLKAGGTGLNLTAASYVILFDPWWNPAVEAQAIDRTHRIGQDRTVIAYRMLSEDTVEDKIWELQQKKAALARDVLGEDGFARTMTREDLDYLLAEV